MAKSTKAAGGRKAASAKAPSAKTAAAKAASAKAKTKAVPTTAKRGTPVKAARARAASRAPAARAPAKRPAAKSARIPGKPKSAAAKSAVVKVASAKAPPAKAAAPRPVAAKPVAAKAPAQAPAKPAPARRKAGDFSVNDYVVYPTHGVGRIRAIEEQEIAGLALTLFVVEFEKEKMTLRVPIAKANATGMRRLSSPDKMKSALQTLKGRARVKRTMWSRRAQEYEAKINSGDPVSIAEVVRDLHRASGQPEQSYSERQIYENALDRLSRELAAVEGLDDDQASERLEKVLKAA